MEFTKEMIKQLEKLRDEKKFLPDSFYPGAPSETIRLEAQHILNQTIENLINNFEKSSDKQYVLSELEKMLVKMNDYDSEEQDQICIYCENIMDILKIESSNGLLNKWRYGF